MTGLTHAEAGACGWAWVCERRGRGGGTVLFAFGGVGGSFRAYVAGGDTYRTVCLFSLSK